MEVDTSPNTRNITIISHIDHGMQTFRSILSDNQQPMHYIPYLMKIPHIIDSTVYDINLIDCVSTTMRLIDGVVIIVDSVEGLCVNTESMIRYALIDKITHFVLYLNKIDRLIGELQLTAEELYQQLNRHIECVNTILDPEGSISGSPVVDPIKGSVSFGSAKQNWSFRLIDFAKIVGEKIGLDPKKILKRLWGEHYYDIEARKFYSNPFSPSGKKLERFVCSMVLNPLLRLYNAIASNDLENLEKMLPKIGVELNEDLQEGKQLFRVLNLWLPAKKCLMNLIIENLPSPIDAQKYRVDTIYSGEPGDICYNAIRDCDPKGPLMMFVYEVRKGSTFGRIYSGTLKTNIEIRILGNNYVAGEDSDFIVKKIPRVTGKNEEEVNEVLCGNIVQIFGIDDTFEVTATITDTDKARLFTPLYFDNIVLAKRILKPKNPSHLTKLIAALKRAQDTILQFTVEDNECILTSIGELHIEVFIKDLREHYLDKEVELESYTPFQIRESVKQLSRVTCFAKLHNQSIIHFTAEPLNNSLVKKLETGKIKVHDRLAMINQLQEEGWSQTEANGIWFFRGTNCIVDATQGGASLQSIKNLVNKAFSLAVEQGVFCNEPMHGICFKIVDFELNNTITNNEINISKIHRALLAAQLSAYPCIMEPIHLVTIAVTTQMLTSAYVALKTKAQIIDEISKPPMFIINALIPFLFLSDLSSRLRSETSGQAFIQSNILSHYNTIDGDLYEAGTRSNLIAKEVRSRKHLSDEFPII